MPQVSAIVLAGGNSERLGRDKALLKLDGRYVLEHILGTLSALSDDLLIVANDAQKLARFGPRVVPDARSGLGPLGGIYAGLLAMHRERGLVVGCDMPLLNLQLLHHMVQLASESDVVIPRIAGQLEPLHAVYSKACLPQIESVLDRGERRSISFFPSVDVRYVEQAEINRYDPQHLSFFNINTPDDLERARELLEQRPNRCKRRHAVV